MNKLLCAAALLLGGATAVADTVVINFETLAAGSTVSSLYAALGVHFSTTPATDPQGMTHAGIDVTQAPGGSFGTRSANLWTSAVIIAFDYDVTSFSVLVEDTERGSLLATARAYDAKGQLAAFASEMTGNYNGPGYYQGTLHLEAPQIQQGRGNILFTASMTSFFGLPRVFAYTTAKSAYLGMVRSLAVDLSPRGIRVNGIAPGFIETEISRRAMAGDPARKEKVLRRTPRGRFGHTEDIGWAAVYLCSPAAKFVNGVVLPVDGGMLIGF